MSQWDLLNFGQKYKVNNGWELYKVKWSDLQKVGHVMLF